MRNCFSCTKNSDTCGKCSEGYQLDSGLCGRFDISLQPSLFPLYRSVQTVCPIKGCKVCVSSAESCDECLEEKARFDSESNSCTINSDVEESGTDDKSSGQDMKVIVIIGEKYIYLTTVSD